MKRWDQESISLKSNTTYPTLVQEIRFAQRALNQALGKLPNKNPFTRIASPRIQQPESRIQLEDRDCSTAVGADPEVRATLDA